MACRCDWRGRFIAVGATARQDTNDAHGAGLGGGHVDDASTADTQSPSMGDAVQRGERAISKSRSGKAAIRAYKSWRVDTRNGRVVMAVSSAPV